MSIQGRAGAPRRTCRYRSASRGGLTCSKQQQSISVVLQLQVPVPEESYQQVPFPFQRGVGLWGGAQRWGSQDPKRPQQLEHSSQSPLIPRWVEANV